MANNSYTFTPYAQNKYAVSGTCSIELSKNFIKLLMILVGKSVGSLKDKVKASIFEEQTMIGLPQATLDELAVFNWEDQDQTELLTAITPEITFLDIPKSQRIILLYHAIRALFYHQDETQKLAGCQSICEQLGLDKVLLKALFNIVVNEHSIEKKRKELFFSYE